MSGSRGTKVKQFSEQEVKKLLYFEDGTTLRMQFFNPVPLGRKARAKDPHKSTVVGYDANKKTIKFTEDFISFLAGQKSITGDMIPDILQQANELKESVRTMGDNKKSINSVIKIQADNEQYGSNRKYTGAYRTEADAMFNTPNRPIESIKLKKEKADIRQAIDTPPQSEVSGTDADDEGSDTDQAKSREVQSDEMAKPKEDTMEESESRMDLNVSQKVEKRREGAERDDMAKEDTNVLKNVKTISENMNMKEQQEQKQSVREVPTGQAKDIIDPTSGENNIDNIQLAISEYNKRTGKSLHVNDLFRNAPEQQSLMSDKKPSYGTAQKPTTYGTMDMNTPQQLDMRTQDEPVEPDETKEGEPVLRGQTQQQGMGGRQRIGGRRPPNFNVGNLQNKPSPAMQNIDESGLTIPQEVERTADGDGRLGINPSAVPQMDIENETIKRNKKTIQQLKTECECFKAIYKDKIKTQKFKQLMNMDLKKKSLDEIRKIHKHYTEEVRDYYNSHRGLRVGVIVDPAILGLSVNALQGMLAPRVPSYTPAIDAGRRAEGFEQVGSELRRKPPTGQTPALSQSDVHYKLGGVRHATGKYDRDIESINSHIDLQEDKKISAFGRSSTRFGKPKRFKNNMYQVPKHTNIPSIRLKTK